MVWRGCGRKRSWPKVMHYSSVSCRDWGKPWITSIRILVSSRKLNQEDSEYTAGVLTNNVQRVCVRKKSCFTQVHHQVIMINGREGRIRTLYRGIFWYTILTFTWRDWEYPQNSHSSYSSCRESKLRSPVHESEKWIRIRIDQADCRAWGTGLPPTTATA
jgi:hypothetical protein